MEREKFSLTPSTFSFGHNSKLLRDYKRKQRKKRSSRYVHLASDAPGLRSGGKARNWSKSIMAKLGCVPWQRCLCISLSGGMPCDCPAFNFTGEPAGERKKKRGGVMGKKKSSRWSCKVTPVGTANASVTFKERVSMDLMVFLPPPTTDMIFCIIPVILPLGLVLYQLSSEQWSLPTLWCLIQCIITVISGDSRVLAWYNLRLCALSLCKLL